MEFMNDIQKKKEPLLILLCNQINLINNRQMKGDVRLSSMFSSTV